MIIITTEICSADTKNSRKRTGVPTKSDPKAKRVKKTLDKENLHVAKSEVYVTFVSSYTNNSDYSAA